MAALPPHPYPPAALIRLSPTNKRDSSWLSTISAILPVGSRAHVPPGARIRADDGAGIAFECALHALQNRQLVSLHVHFDESQRKAAALLFRQRCRFLILARRPKRESP